MKNYKVLIASGAILTLSALTFTGCGNNNTAAQNTTDSTTATQSTVETTTAASTTQATQATTKADSNKSAALGKGEYVCKSAADGLTISYTSTEESSSQSNNIQSHEWKTSLPPDYVPNKYSDPIICFYDVEHGAFFAPLGSGAGSSYYTPYATTDGGVTWIKLDKQFKMTNSANQILFTDKNTMVALDSGIGIAIPSISVFHIDGTDFKITCTQKYLTEIPDMVKSISMTATDSTHIQCEYVADNGTETKTVTIDLSKYKD